jgi:putative transposase
MKDWRSMAHVTWECKYHVVIVPKYRRKVFYGRRRREIGRILRQLCRQKDVELIEGNAAADHIHMLLSVPPKYSIAMTIGFLWGWMKRGFENTFATRRSMISNRMDSRNWTSNP